ncbi:hypothetical protein RIU14_04990 [Riemerella anatipestifer]|uniref:hypothetical protein n=2 Tax=Riemerella anatipestifer TaxID=34085 RepID=UPI00285A2D5E|nr:hypothetical protein [Riemerella anatipestifer]MDR7694124.1 hypothetical protein [Riemerella anatipestifer]
MKKILLILVLFISAVSCGTDKEDKTLTNQSIIDLVNEGMGDDLICEFISENPTQFKVAEMKDIIYLKENNVSERVIMEMKTKEKKQKDLYDMKFIFMFLLSIIIGLIFIKQ